MGYKPPFARMRDIHANIQREISLDVVVPEVVVAPVPEVVAAPIPEPEVVLMVVVAAEPEVIVPVTVAKSEIVGATPDFVVVDDVIAVEAPVVVAPKVEKKAEKKGDKKANGK